MVLKEKLPLDYHYEELTVIFYNLEVIQLVIFAWCFMVNNYIQFVLESKQA